MSLFDLCLCSQCPGASAFGENCKRNELHRHLAAKACGSILSDRFSECHNQVSDLLMASTIQLATKLLIIYLFKNGIGKYRIYCCVCFNGCCDKSDDDILKLLIIITPMAYTVVCWVVYVHVCSCISLCRSMLMYVNVC